MTSHLDPQLAAAIADNVALVQEKLLTPEGIDHGDWRAGVAYLDGFIERQRVREDFDPGRLPDVLGSFLGEAMVQCHGGVWVADDAGTAVELAGGGRAFPFAKTRKQFDGGAESGESILSFFDVTPSLSMMTKGASDE